MSQFRVLIVLGGLLAATPAVAQVFEPAQGDETIREASAGTRRVVEGIDLWTVGGPPCRYRILGYVHDKRHRLNVFGLAGEGAIEVAVAKVAKRAGGDGMYLMSADAEDVGSLGVGVGGGRSTYHESTTVSGNSAVTRGSGSGVGVSLGGGVGIRRIESRYAVFKCLPPEAAAAPPPDAPGPVIGDSPATPPAAAPPTTSDPPK